MSDRDEEYLRAIENLTAQVRRIADSLEPKLEVRIKSESDLFKGHYANDPDFTPDAQEQREFLESIAAATTPRPARRGPKSPRTES